MWHGIMNSPNPHLLKCKAEIERSSMNTANCLVLDPMCLIELVTLSSDTERTPRRLVAQLGMKIAFDVVHTETFYCLPCIHFQTN